MRQKSKKFVDSELFHIRQKMEDVKRAINSCERAINSLEEEKDSYSLKDYLIQLNLFLTILKLQIKKGLNYRQMAKEIGFYETKLTTFSGISNVDFSLDDRAKIINYISKNL